MFKHQHKFVLAHKIVSEEKTNFFNTDNRFGDDKREIIKTENGLAFLWCECGEFKIIKE